MASTDVASGNPVKNLLLKFWQPPFVGLVTAFLMLMGVGIAHALMVAFHNVLGDEYVYRGSLLTGAASIVLLWYAVKSKSENFATWTGFFCGIFVWMTWVEFFYMYYGRENLGMLPRIYGDGDIGEPEYLIMAATTGVLMTMLVFYTFDKDTRCNMFIFFQKHLGLRDGLGPSTKTARDRNYAIITFMETFYVTWFVYAWNLIIFDPTFVGTGEDALYASLGTVFVSITWGGFCLSRLIKYKRTSSALRYAIPTANILWINLEIFSHWGWLTEIWLEPGKYWLEMGAITGAFVIMSALIYKSPKKPSEVGDW